MLHFPEKRFTFVWYNCPVAVCWKHNVILAWLLFRVVFHFLKKMHLTRRKNLTGLVCFKIFFHVLFNYLLTQVLWLFLTPYLLEKKGCGAYWKNDLSVRLLFESSACIQGRHLIQTFYLWITVTRHLSFIFLFC